MLFRNLVLYRLPPSFSVTAPDLESALERRPLKPCGSFENATRGFVACGYEQRLLYSQGQHHLISLGVEQKLLPASVINQVVKERAAELEQQQGHPVGRRQRRELKLQVTDELRARALCRRRSTLAWLDVQDGWLVVDSASPGRAEELVETLRDALGSLPVVPFDVRQAPAGSMANWLTHGDAPGRFTLGEDLELVALPVPGGGTSSGSSVRWTHHALETSEIRAHLVAGKAPTRLGLTWNSRIGFVLQPNLQLKRVRFLDVYKDDNARGENPHEQFDIDFALMTGELRQLLDELAAALGGEQVAAMTEKQAA